jgi:transcriptional regulator with XRE-family HTH domain
MKRIREAAGLSQSELARVARVPVGTVRNWEQSRRVPRLDAATKVARALGVSLDSLAGLSAKPEARRHGRRKGK